MFLPSSLILSFRGANFCGCFSLQRLEIDEKPSKHRYIDEKTLETSHFSW